MKKTLIVLLLVLLCISFCACGSYRNDTGLPGEGTGTHDMTDGGTAEKRPGGNYTGDKDSDRKTDDGMPNAEDGYVEDKQAQDGIIEEETPSPSPNATRKP